jgi:hypothetical protein
MPRATPLPSPTWHALQQVHSDARCSDEGSIRDGFKAALLYHNLRTSRSRVFGTKSGTPNCWQSAEVFAVQRTTNEARSLCRRFPAALQVFAMTRDPVAIPARQKHGIRTEKTGFSWRIPTRIGN